MSLLGLLFDRGKDGWTEWLNILEKRSVARMKKFLSENKFYFLGMLVLSIVFILANIIFKGNIEPNTERVLSCILIVCVTICLSLNVLDIVRGFKKNEDLKMKTVYITIFSFVFIGFLGGILIIILS